MSGLEILGGIAAAASITKVVASFIHNFGTRQNAPQQVKRLERILEDLKNDVHLIESASGRERERLWELVLVAEQTLNDHIEKSKAKANRLLRFFWPEDAEERLKSVNDELQNELVVLGLRVDRRHRASVVALPQGTATVNFSNSSPPLVKDVAPPYTPLSPQQSTQNAASGTALSKRHDLPAVLFLQAGNGVDVVGPLKVKFLRVVERDETTRLIHYERKTANSHLEVTHRIPRSCLRFEDDKLDDLQVHFLDAHPITVVRTGKGHEVYFLHAKYEFTSLQHREEFIFRMLERESLDRFYADEILYRGQLLAQGKVVRLWRKKEEGGDKMATKLTFLARDERQREWDTVQFIRVVDIDGDTKVILREDGKGKGNASTSTTDRELVIKFHPPPTTRKQSVSTSAKKRQRPVSGQTPSHGPEEKRPQPERKKSTFSLRRFSRTGISKETLSPDLSHTRTETAKEALSPDLLSRSPESPSPSLGYGFDLHTSKTDDNTTSNVKSDAERFKEVFQKFHPTSTPDFNPLPPIATGATGLALAWESEGGEFKTGFGFTVNNGYTFEDGKGHAYASSIATSMSSPVSPKAEVMASSSSATTTCSGGTGATGGGVIQPRLEGLYPP